jgi:formylglycine-generating enzyme required for sulfatase activity
VIKAAACCTWFVVGLFLLPSSVLLSQDSPERAKLRKELDTLDAQVRQEGERIQKRKKEVEAEWQRLNAADVRARLAEKLQQLVGSQQESLRGPNAADCRTQMRKETFSLLKENVGLTIAGMLDEDLVNNLCDRWLESGRIDSAKLLDMTVTDAFGEDGFDKAFEEFIKPAIARSGLQLIKRREELAQRIATMDEAEAARKAGVLPGMLAVPAGTYQIGISESELKKLADRMKYGQNLDSLILQWRSTEAHQVKLEPYFMDRHEVTCAWWQAYLTENPKAAVPMNWTGGKMPEGWEQRPVTGITFEDAEAFAHWCGRRIPTEFEWEAAARWTKDPAKDPRFWPWGEWDRELRCNYEGATNHAGRRATQANLPPMLPVGTFPGGSSALGFEDLAGNAYEMTASPFEPYKGFKGATINRRRVSAADFNSDEISLRGGDCGKRDFIVSTFSRLGFPRNQKAMWVGFRTAASALRGKDTVDWLTQKGSMTSWLVDYAPLPSDTMARRSHAELDTNNSMAIGALSKGGWNEAASTPTRAESIAIVNRMTQEFRDFATLKQFAQSEKSRRVMIGFLHTDLDVVSPPLPAGDYFVHWQASATIENGPESINDATARLKSGEDLPPNRSVRVPDCFVFERRGAAKPYSIYIDSWPPPVVADSQGTRVLVQPAKDQLELVYSFGIKGQPKLSFTITFPMKLKPAEKDQSGNITRASDAAALR